MSHEWFVGQEVAMIGSPWSGIRKLVIEGFTSKLVKTSGGNNWLKSNGVLYGASNRSTRPHIEPWTHEHDAIFAEEKAKKELSDLRRDARTLLGLATRDQLRVVIDYLSANGASDEIDFLSVNGGSDE